MKINKEEARLAGELTNNLQWTDEDLKTMIAFEELVLEFLKGKGPRWYLATNKLTNELEQFKSIITLRKNYK